ncbi:MAG: CinA domain protein [Actinotalea sp.]|nr:CinA domain protein [Actinotalea sp.]
MSGATGEIPAGADGASGDDRGPRAPAGDAELLIGLLTRAGLTVAVAESLTGGAVIEALIAVPGASACVRGGVVAYAADLKMALLGVPADLIADVGTVHPDVARAMAAGIRERLAADVGIATTGVAGPGPQEGRAAGTFHVAVVGPWGADVRSGAPAAGPAEDTAGPDRTTVRRTARDAALALAVSVATSGTAPRG